MTATKKGSIASFSAYRERRKDNWHEYIAIYNSEGNKIADSGNNHPEGRIYFLWEGFEFIAPMPYSGEGGKGEVYVRLTDKVFLEEPLNPKPFNEQLPGCNCGIGPMVLHTKNCPWHVK